MKLLALNCNHCGAPIHVPPRVRFLTCEFCESKLEVKHEGNAHFTETLETIQKELAELKLRERLRSIDDAWERERKGLMIDGKHGRTRVPTRGGAVMLGIVGVTLGILATATAGGIGVLILLLGLGMALYLNGRAAAYEDAHANYKHRRLSVMRETRT